MNDRCPHMHTHHRDSFLYRLAKADVDPPTKPTPARRRKRSPHQTHLQPGLALCLEGPETKLKRRRNQAPKRRRNQGPRRPRSRRQSHLRSGGNLPRARARRGKKLKRRRGRRRRRVDRLPDRLGRVGGSAKLRLPAQLRARGKLRCDM